MLREGEKTRCLDSNTALDFALGRLPADAVAVSDQHLDVCTDGRLVVAEAVRALRERSTAPVDGPPEVESASVTRLRRGDVLAGRYLIQRFIARGGMGEVYEALDQLLSERIAVKTVVASISDDLRAVERLKVETNLSRRVTHPNVCRIFDIGVHEQARGSGRESVFFITMEFVPGHSLGHTLRVFGPMDFESARPLIEGMVAGLHAAHRVGLVHRDFKSENVMLAPSADGAVLRSVVMDFGLARVDSGMSSRLSNEGKPLVGTVAYMAPEQVEGDPVTPATDIYALGVVMFEMATGELPFPSESLMEAATRRLVHDAPLARSVRPEVDSRWESVIARCLERDPPKRYASATQVLEALEPGTPPPVSAAEIPVPQVAGKRRRLLVGVGIAATAAAGVLALGLRRGPSAVGVTPERVGPALVLERTPDAGVLAAVDAQALSDPGGASTPKPSTPATAREPAGLTVRRSRARRAAGSEQEVRSPATDPPLPDLAAETNDRGPPETEPAAPIEAAAPDEKPATPTPRSQDPEDGFILPKAR